MAALVAQLKTAPGPSSLAPIDQRLKWVTKVTEAADSKGEDTCSGLIFKRKCKADVAAPAPSGSEGQATLYREAKCQNEKVKEEVILVFL